MAAVWMAEQSEPVQRRVAIKLIRAGLDSAQVIARFEAEGERQAKVQAQRAAAEQRTREQAQKRLAQVEKATEVLESVFRDLGPKAEANGQEGRRTLRVGELSPGPGTPDGAWLDSAPATRMCSLGRVREGASEPPP